ncbi:MAG: PGPGW domain-containing protein [Sandaracinaceae bacterium]|nr:PGPGW domain-containing protein [Sandaracinaceae bacterium]
MSLARKIVVGVTGGAVLTVGVAMIVLPGPAIVVAPLGLAILATEFSWAKGVLTRAQDKFAHVKRRVARKASRPA